MKYWTVILTHKEKTIELTVKAKSYSDAFVHAQFVYSECRVISIKPIKDHNNK